MNINNIEILDIVQGSEEWFKIRREHITSTDVAVIKGNSRFKSKFQIWQEKMDIGKEQPLNFKMKEGSLLEKEAREWYNKKHGTNFQPACIKNKKYPWLFTSLDGYDRKTGEILEIKCGEATYAKIAKGSVPIDYIDQAQHHICLSEQRRCHYLAYRPDKEPLELFIERDQLLIDHEIEVTKEFFSYIENMVPPPLTEKEFVEISDETTIKIAQEWRLKELELKKLTQEVKKLKEMLKDQTDDGNCIIPAAGVKIERIVRKGTIDYEKLLADHKISPHEVEKYRKPEISYLHPSILKEMPSHGMAI